jgi:hypothetical protein
MKHGERQQGRTFSGKRTILSTAPCSLSSEGIAADPDASAALEVALATEDITALFAAELEAPEDPSNRCAHAPESSEF